MVCHKYGHSGLPESIFHLPLTLNTRLLLFFFHVYRVEAQFPKSKLCSLIIPKKIKVVKRKLTFKRTKHNYFKNIYIKLSSVNAVDIIPLTLSQTTSSDPLQYSLTDSGALPPKCVYVI